MTLFRTESNASINSRLIDYGELSMPTRIRVPKYTNPYLVSFSSRNCKNWHTNAILDDTSTVECPI